MHTLSRRACLAAWPLLACLPGRAHAAPSRIAVLDWSLAETMLALGAVPAAVGEAPGYRRWLAEPALPPEAVDLGLLTEPNLELLVQLRPDLILLGNGQEAEIGDLLQRIAPTLALSIYDGSGDPLARARQVALDLATALGRPEAATALLAAADLRLAAAQARLDAVRRPEPALVLLLSDERHGWVADRGGLIQGVLDRLGRTNGWPGPASFWGFTTIGIDALAALPARDLLVGDFMLPEPAALTDSPVWRALPAVRAGRIGTLPRFWYFGGLPTACRLTETIAAALATMPQDGIG
ncbi:MAG: ABC transporter substrate-binding protein [Geminicoccaceae bacterium]